MNIWPQAESVVSEKEREKTYLTLVDMFVDVVEPSVIQMILQNRKWDLDAALEDIMVLSSPSQSNNTKSNLKQNPSARPSSENGLDKIKLSYSSTNAQFPPKNAGQRSPFANVMPSNSKQFEKSSPSKKSTSANWKTISPRNRHDKSSNSAAKQSEGSILPFVEHYNYLKTITHPLTRTVMLIKDGIKLMVILRGLPGSGKSELASKILTEAGISQTAQKRHIFSTDNFFVQNGCYVFIRELLVEAHAWNQRSVFSAVKEDLSPVIVDNTNCEVWEMKVYADLAVKAGYDIELLEPDTWWAKKEGELAKRNVHGVPRGTIHNMLDRYEKCVSTHSLLQRCQLQYSLSNAPPQPARNSKWKDKFNVQKNNKPKKKRAPPDQNSFCNLNSAVPPDSSNRQPFLSTECDIFRNVPISIEPNLIPGNAFAKPYPFENKESFTVVEGVGVSCENVNEKISLEPQTSGFSNYSPGAVMKSFSTPSVSNSIQGNSNHDVGSSLSLNSYGLAASESFSNCQSDDHKTQNSFDFMAESNKLLAAMKRPQFSNETLAFGNGEAHKNSEPVDEKNVLFSDLKPGDDWREQPPIVDCPGSDEYRHVQLNKIRNSTLEQNGSTEICKELVASIIDDFKVEETETGNGTSTDCLDVTVGVEKSKNHSEKSSDYVLVNEDNTYTYQRLDSNPLCTNPFSEDYRFPITSVIENNCMFDSSMLTSPNVKVNETVEGTESPSKEYSGIFEGFKKLNIKSEPEELPSSCNNFQSSILDVRENSLEKCNQNESKPSLEQNNTNLFGMMDEILKGMSPLCENLTIRTNSHQEEQKCQQPNFPTPPAQQNDTPSQNPYCDWGLGEYWSKESMGQQVTEPKPSRNLNRPKLLDYTGADKNKQRLPELKQEDFNSWGCTSSHSDDWTVIENAGLSPTEEKPVILPQRERLSNRKLADSSTNTNYADFSLLKSENIEGSRTLVAHRRSITEDNSWQTKTDVSETMHLDKSTMTLENHLEPSKTYDLNHITSLFPDIPESFISDVVEKCQGDVNWAVDILLDSEHSVYADPGLAPLAQPQELPPDSGLGSDDKPDLPEIEDPARQKNEKPPRPSVEGLAEAKRMIENVVVFGKSHYSDKVLKLLKRKHPQYSNLIEHAQLTPERGSSTSAESDVVVASAENDRENVLGRINGINEAYESRGDYGETASDSNSESGSVNSKSTESSDDIEDLQLIFNSDLILQLQQKFGNSSLPRIPSTSPVVRLPVGLARQLYGYIMDSLQSQLDEQQADIERMIAQDEEIAKLIQSQDEDKSQQSLQEIMDLELALQVHRADQEVWREKDDSSVAARLSKSILMEKFPQVDPKALAEVLHSHNYSLHDAVASLHLALGTEAGGSSAPTMVAHYDEEGDEEGSRGGEAADPAAEAQSHREEAATYYNMRIDCLNKAQTAFRAGNKSVASYYSNLARLHKSKIETCNSRAAACLLSSHKCGSDTLDLHFLHVSEAQVVLDMFLDEVVAEARDRGRRGRTVFLITGRGARSAGGVSRIKPMVQRTLNHRSIPFNEINPGMLHATVRMDTPLSCAE